MHRRILIVDDDRDMCEVVAAKLRRGDWEAHWVSSAQDALSVLQAESFDVVLTDLNMPGTNGVELCERIVQNQPDVPVVVITAFGSLETAVASIRAGAYDFVTKPIDMDLLLVALRRAWEHRSLQQQVRRLSETVERAQPFEELIGESPAMKALFEQLGRIAPTDATVLLSGESGTGKELAARALHGRSRRRDGPFLAVNCSALPEALLESELFGHEKGAFTDARSKRDGLLVHADGGTLLLDEVGDMPLALQPRLLRALEERRVRPVGSDREVAFDVRVIAATNQDLEGAVEEGRFREDLFYRLNVIPVHMPPLRARGTDVLLVAQHFLRQFAGRFGKPVKGVSDSVAKKLLAYDWPGNVREVRNAMERAVALTRFELLTVDDLPEKIRDYQSSQLLLAGNDPADLLRLEEMERRYILHVLKSVGGNRTLAARILGIARRTLYRKLESGGVAGDAARESDD
jgi:two-component system response regulator HydG